MLIVVAFDAVSTQLVDRLVAQGRLPTLAALRATGTTMRLRSPADLFPASVYPTLYTGVSVARSGIYYPFQWSPTEQRVRYVEDLVSTPSPAVWEHASRAGLRVLVVDPYESRPPRHATGLYISGWQLRNRIVLPATSVPADAYRRLVRRFGQAPLVDEVLGAPSASSLARMRRHLLAAPGRVSRLACETIARGRFDLIWLSFPASHLAGHQFWDRPDPTSGASVEAVYEATDAAIGATLAALPDDADIIVFSALGMTANTSRSDLLPGMLDSVLNTTRRTGFHAPGSAMWRLRASVPTEVRTAIAARLPRRAVLGLTAGLDLRLRDWSNVRAFPLPSDSVGYIRLNLRGREREGIVTPTEIDSLVEEIRAGLTTFVDPDGRQSVASVDRVADALGAEAQLDLLPDLVVRWAEHPSAAVAHVQSEEFGVIGRYGDGSGRSGNHDDDAWVLVLARSSRRRSPVVTPAITSIPASVGAALGFEVEGIDGEPLLAAG